MRVWNHLAQNTDQWAVTETAVRNTQIPISFIKAKRKSNSGPQRTWNILKTPTCALIMRAAGYSETSDHLHQTARNHCENREPFISIFVSYIFDGFNFRDCRAVDADRKLLTWCVFVRTSLHMRSEEKPSRCHWMVYCTYNMLKMFQVDLCPSSGARDYMCVITAYAVQCLGCRWSEVRYRVAGYASGMRDFARAKFLISDG